MMASARAPEYRKKIRDQREWRSTSQASNSTMDVAGICRLRREISAAWRRAERGEGGGKAEGSGGFIGAALVDNQGVGNARGNYSGDVTGRGEGEGGSGGDDRWVPPVGERKRERGYRFGLG
jgi:hypothetical protein